MRWLSADELDTVRWLPADKPIVAALPPLLG
jgi:8-oxo-dGTP diphosphatase